MLVLTDNLSGQALASIPFNRALEPTLDTEAEPGNRSVIPQRPNRHPATPGKRAVPADRPKTGSKAEPFTSPEGGDDVRLG